MELTEARQKFIQAFGALGTSWGVNRTMAQVHALLLISPKPLSAEDVMEELQISRGNANMNLRALIDWGLVRKEYKAGERREFFVAEKDMWRLSTQIIQERQKRELAPIMQVLKEVKNVNQSEETEESTAFVESVAHIEGIVSQANDFLDFVVRAERNWFTKNMLSLLAKQHKKPE
jgi:DNA-binding transcriptional regulator GbsR (MarR family)